MTPDKTNAWQRSSCWLLKAGFPSIYKKNLTDLWFVEQNVAVFTTNNHCQVGIYTCTCPYTHMVHVCKCQLDVAILLKGMVYDSTDHHQSKANFISLHGTLYTNFRAATRSAPGPSHPVLVFLCCCVTEPALGWMRQGRTSGV